MTENYVPVGAASFNVASTAGLSEGLPIVVFRPSTQAWIEALGMDQISGEPAENQWMAGQRDQYYERVITRVEGNRVFLNAPIMHALELQYGGGRIYQYRYPRITQVGIENIRGISDFSGPTDEDHARSFIELAAVSDAWVRNVTGKHFVYATVHAKGHSIRVTVDGARSLEPISQITGGRRYPFNIDGQFVLMKNLYSEGGRHDFVNNSSNRNRGPNVFLNGWAKDSNSTLGPHQKYSTGTLYDTVGTDNQIEARNRGAFGTAHGWGGANMVFWNTAADRGNIIQSPPTAQNWIIGGQGRLINERRLGQQPPPIADSHGTAINFGDPNNPTNSLFVAQHNQRIGLNASAAALERRDYVIGDFDLGNYDGVGTVDDVDVDSAWNSSLATVVGNATAAPFDTSGTNQFVPMSFNYQLDSNESVYAATLTLGLRGTSGDSSDDTIFVGSTDDMRPLSAYLSETLTTDETTPVTIELLAADLLKLQNGQLNLAINGDTVVDWANIELQIGENFSPNLIANASVVSGQASEMLLHSGTWSDPESQEVMLSASIGEIVKNANGTWDWSLQTTRRYESEVVVITATDSLGSQNTTTFQINATSFVVQRGISYGNSFAFDDTDIPESITALLPGETAGDTHYSNYHRGLNRVVIDIAGLDNGSFDVQNDLKFRVGNNDQPLSWLQLSDTSDIPLPEATVIAGGNAGVTRIILSWPDQAIQNTWLQVVVKANNHNGLQQADVFYFGHQTGDVYGRPDLNFENRLRVNSTDTLFVRLNQSSGEDVGIDNRYDIDRSGRVNAFDAIFARLNQTAGGLLMFTAPNIVTTDITSSGGPSIVNLGLDFTTFAAVENLSSRDLRSLNRLHQRLSSTSSGENGLSRSGRSWALRLHRAADQSDAIAARLIRRGHVETAARRSELAMIFRSLAYHLETSQLSASSASMASIEPIRHRGRSRR